MKEQITLKTLQTDLENLNKELHNSKYFKGVSRSTGQAEILLIGRNKWFKKIRKYLKNFEDEEIPAETDETLQALFTELEKYDANASKIVRTAGLGWKPIKDEDSEEEESNSPGQEGEGSSTESEYSLKTNSTSDGNKTSKNELKDSKTEQLTFPLSDKDFNSVTLKKRPRYWTPSTKKRLAFATLFVPLIYFEASNIYNIRDNTWEFVQNNPLLFAVLVGMSLALIYAVDKNYLATPSTFENSIADTLAEHKKSVLISTGVIAAGAAVSLIYFEVTQPQMPSKTLEFMQNNMPLLIGLTVLALIKLAFVYRQNKNDFNLLVPDLEKENQSFKRDPSHDGVIIPPKQNILKEQIPWLLGLGMAITANLAYQNADTTVELFSKAMQSLAITIPVLIVGEENSPHSSQP
jgi:hypothetical protein